MNKPFVIRYVDGEERFSIADIEAHGIKARFHDFAENTGGVEVNLFVGDPDGSVSRYTSGAKAFETLTNGTKIYSGSNACSLYYSNTHFIIENHVDGGGITFYAKNAGGTNRLMAHFDPDGTFDMFHNGVLSYEQNPGLIRLWAIAKAGQDFLEIQHDGTDAYVRNFLHGGNVIISGQDTGGVVRDILVGDPDGAAELYYAGNKVAETFEEGMSITGDLEYLNISTVTAETTASNADVILTDSGSYTVYLTEKDRAIIRVKNIDSGNTITVQGLLGTIDGSANITLTSQYESVTVVSDGTNWFIV